MQSDLEHVVSEDPNKIKAGPQQLYLKARLSPPGSLSFERWTSCNSLEYAILLNNKGILPTGKQKSEAIQTPSWEGSNKKKGQRTQINMQKLYTTPQRQ